MVEDLVLEKEGQDVIFFNYIINFFLRLFIIYDRKFEGIEEKVILFVSVFNFFKMKLDRYKLGDDKKVSFISNWLDRYRGLLGIYGRMFFYEKLSFEDVRVGGLDIGEEEVYEQKLLENI